MKRPNLIMIKKRLRDIEIVDRSYIRMDIAELLQYVDELEKEICRLKSVFELTLKSNIFQSLRIEKR